MKIPDEGLLRLVARSEYEQVSSESQVLCMTATLTAQNVDANTRAPLNIICVIDHSASMTRRFDLMKQTLSFMVENMRSSDTLTLITFDSSVQTILPRTHMDADGASLALDMIKQCKLGQGTNLSGGLFEGFESLKSYTGDAVSSLMLFTDGEATAGIRSPHVILQRTQRYVSEISKPFSLFTFGYGKTHDAELLRNIAEVTNGMYYFINGPEAIPTSFGSCMGGLLTVVAQNIRLSLNAMPEVRIVKMYSSFKKDDQGRYLMGDLYSEERRDIVFEVIVPHYCGVSDEMQPLVHIDVTYKNVVTQQEEHLYTDCKVLRTDKLFEKQQNLEVDMQRNRAKMTLALKQSLLVAQFNLKDARELLEWTIHDISTTSSANTPFVEALLETLQTAMLGLVDSNTYQSIGSKKLNSVYIESDRQRSTGTDSLSAHYTTSFKQMCSGTFSSRSFPPKQ